MEIINSFIKKIKLVQFLALMLIVTSIFIFSNDNFLSNVGVLSIKVKYQEWIGLGFIVSAAGFIILVIEKSYKFLHTKYSWYRAGKLILKKLNVEEQQILIRYFYNFEEAKFNMTAYVDMTTEVPTLLTSRGLAVRSANMAYDSAFPYTLHPYIYELLELALKKGKIKVTKENYEWNY